MSTAKKALRDAVNKGYERKMGLSEAGESIVHTELDRHRMNSLNIRVQMLRNHIEVNPMEQHKPLEMTAEELFWLVGKIKELELGQSEYHKFAEKTLAKTEKRIAELEQRTKLACNLYGHSNFDVEYDGVTFLRCSVCGVNLEDQNE